MPAVVVDAVVAPEAVHESLEYGADILWVLPGPSHEDNVVPDGGYDLCFFQGKKWPVIKEGAAAPRVQAKFVFTTVDEEHEVTTELEDGNRDVDWASIPTFISDFG